MDVIQCSVSSCPISIIGRKTFDELFVFGSFHVIMLANDYMRMALNSTIHAIEILYQTAPNHGNL